MICKHGSAECDITESNYVQCQCPACDGAGCDKCEQGFWRLTECGRKFVGSMATAVNYATYADKGILPVGGGLLDQSNWFIEVWTALSNEQSAIDRERYG